MYKDEECHASIDLETLGTNSEAPIVQIGLVIFTENTIITKAQWTIDIEDALKYGRPDGSTIQWWLGQSEEARNNVFNIPCKDIKSCIDALIYTISTHNIEHYWAHATFDFPILTSLFEKLNRPNPIKFWTCKDLRTIEYLVPDVPMAEREGIHHNALDDALYQAERVQKLLTVLKERTND